MTVPEVRAILRHLLDLRKWDVNEIVAWSNWHSVLRPSEDGLMGRMLRWGTATHTQHYHAHDHTAGRRLALRFAVAVDADGGTPFKATLAVGDTLRPRGRPRKA